MTCTTTLARSLFLVSLTFTLPIVYADGQQGTRETMADAMSKMMEAMGMFNPSPGSSLPSDPMSMAKPFGGPAWMPGGGGFGMPWGSPFQDPSRAMGMGEEMMKRFSPDASPLEGIWEGRNGELVVVQGKRFRIYSGAAGYVDGYVHVQGDRMAMYTTGERQARPFEYAESNGRLVLRDAGGQTYLYRRLRLDNVQSSIPPPAPEP